MLHNIFSKNKKNKIKNKSKIIIDIHEKNSLVPAELINNPNLEIIFKHLLVGDYLINNIIIERKEINDFYSSLISKRLDKQIINLKKIKNKLILIEGEIKNIKRKINPNIIYGKI
ncbi:hypothetical protein GOV12_02990, partial [Candidatus Pacearchaeota archaeon]|nr:hypothetical protein [Candidatus Pacearchaeota archaeon]